jgi:hypothetical protein
MNIYVEDFSEKSVNFYQNKRCYISEDYNFQSGSLKELQVQHTKCF